VAWSEPVPHAEIERKRAVLVARQHPRHLIVLRVLQQEDLVIKTRVIQRARIGEIDPARNALSHGHPRAWIELLQGGILPQEWRHGKGVHQAGALHHTAHLGGDRAGHQLRQHRGHQSVLHFLR